MLKFILSIFMVNALLACASGPPKEIPTPNEYTIGISNPSDIKVLSFSGKDHSGTTTRMVGAGSLFLSVPTNEKVTPFDEKLRKVYGKNISDILIHHNVFKSIEYIGDDIEIPANQDYLALNFLETFRGENGWPTRIKIQYIYSKSGNVVLNETFEGNATLLDAGCGNCAPHYIAIDKLHQQFFNALKSKLAN